MPTKSLIVIGPSGVGKGTIIASLLKRNPQHLKFVRSFTTRSRRKQEGEDHYYFVAQNQFASRLYNGELLEAKTVFGKSYGTSKADYMRVSAQGYVPVLDIDVEGMLAVKLALSTIKGQHSSETICVLPPSWTTLRDRLNARGTETQESIALRMAQNKLQVERMRALQGQNINYVVNYQYQLTVYGIELFLRKHFRHFS